MSGKQTVSSRGGSWQYRKEEKSRAIGQHVLDKSCSDVGQNIYLRKNGLSTTTAQTLEQADLSKSICAISFGNVMALPLLSAI